MGTTDLILHYVQSCASGRLGLSDCGPIWQLGVIAALIVAAVFALLVIRFHARPAPEKA